MKKTIKKVVVAGGGLMGAGISLMFPEYGIETVLYSVAEKDFDKAGKVIDKSLAALVENGRLTSQTAEEIKEKIETEKAALTKMKMNNAVSPLENPMLIRTTRRNIARLMTELRKRELNK